MMTSIVTDAIDLPVMKKLIFGHETGAFNFALTLLILYFTEFI